MPTIQLKPGLQWGATDAFPVPPEINTRVVWAVNGENLPGTVIGHETVHDWRHVIVRLDHPAKFWNARQWLQIRSDKDRASIDAAGVELADGAPPEPKLTKEPPFAMVRACLEARRIVGRSWKETVRRAWMDGRYGMLDDISDVLQRLRNAQGPLSWYRLDFKLPFDETQWRHAYEDAIARAE